MAGISRIGALSAKPMSYQVSNQSSVSSSFEDSMAVTSANAVEAAAPVQYANAQAVSSTAPVDQTEALEKTQQVTKDYNDIASTFGGNTGYDASMRASSYQTVGQGFDVYA